MKTYPYYQALATVSGVIRAVPASLRSIKAINRNAAIRYLQIFDSISAPDSTNVPIDQFLVQATSMLTIGTDFFTLSGLTFDIGISWGFSTSAGTYTAATAGEHDFAAVVI